MFFVLRATAASILALGLGAQEADLARLRKDVFAMADPAMEGRATGTPGQRKAAEYLASRFKDAGLLPLNNSGSYTFPYTLVRTRIDAGASTFLMGKTSLKVGEDILTVRTQAASGEILFLGYGIHAPEMHWDDYAQADVKGRWVAMWEGTPEFSQKFNPEGWGRVGQTETKLEAARKAGAAGCIFIQTRPDKEAGFGRMRLFLERSAKRGLITLKGGAARESQTFWLSAEAAKSLHLELKGGAQPGPARAMGAFAYTPKTTQEDVPASNVMGQIPGTDPKLQDEFIVLSAHHDHVGMEGGKLHPGADDNASGTAAILEVARLLKDAKPKRSILVLSVSGEEIGLWGSQAFVNAPPVELARIRADINLDMVGRGPLGELCVTPAKIDNAVASLTRDARAVAFQNGVKLNTEADQYWLRSDHYTFAKRGIPAIFFFGGMHKDYHEPSDTPDRIVFEKLAQVVRLARDLTLRVANAPEPPKLLPKGEWETWAWPSPIPASPLPVAKPR